MSNIILGCMFLMGLMQLPIVEYLPFFTYYDEFVAVLSVLYICLYILKKGSIPKKLFNILALVLVSFAIGSLSSLFSGLNQPLVAQIMDIAYLFKLFICFVAAELFFAARSEDDNRALFGFIYAVVKVLLVLSVILYVAGLFGVGNYFSTARYGLKSYCFIYNSAGMFSQYCVIFIPIVIAGNYTDKTKEQKWILLALLVWASTLRVRAFALIFITLALYWFIFKYQDLSMPVKNRIKSVFKLRYIIPVVLIVFVISRNQIIKYFSSLDSARSILLYYGVKIMFEYAPLGAGFASFCTESAARYYSPLYSRYGISSFWALKEGGSELTDGYWPAIFAELGIVGTIMMATLIFKFSSYMLEKSSGNKWLFFSALVFIIALALSSIATGSYSSYNNTIFVTIMAMIINLKGETNSDG